MSSSRSMNGREAAITVAPGRAAPGCGSVLAGGGEPVGGARGSGECYARTGAFQKRIPAAGPWIANICTGATTARVQFAADRGAAHTHARTCTDPPLSTQASTLRSTRSTQSRMSSARINEELLRWASPLMPVIAVHSPRWACGSGSRRTGVAIPMRPHAESIESSLEAVEARYHVSTVSLSRAIYAMPQPVNDTSFMADCRHVGEPIPATRCSHSSSITWSPSEGSPRAVGASRCLGASGARSVLWATLCVTSR